MCVCFVFSHQQYSLWPHSLPKLGQPYLWAVGLPRTFDLSRDHFAEVMLLMILTTDFGVSSSFEVRLQALRLSLGEIPAFRDQGSVLVRRLSPDTGLNMGLGSIYG